MPKRTRSQQLKQIYEGVLKDAAQTWFTIAVALFVVCTFSIFGIAADQVQEALSNYIGGDVTPGASWQSQAVQIWTHFAWARVVLSFIAVFTFASTLRYWTARLLGLDIDKYEQLQALKESEPWKNDFTAFVFALPWLGAASSFFVAHMLAVDRLTFEASGASLKFQDNPIEYLCLTPFLTVVGLTLLAPIGVWFIWKALDAWRQRISKSDILLLIFDLPMIVMFFGFAALFATNSDLAVETARQLGPMVLLNCSFAFLTATGSFLIVWGREFKLPIPWRREPLRIRLPLFWLAAAIPIVSGVYGCGDNHRLRELRSVSRAAPAPVELAAALKPYETADGKLAAPIVIVSTEGGGIRAAYFTAAVLGRIRDQCPALAQRIFAISGVSGGAVGAAAYVAGLQWETRHDANPSSGACHFDKPGNEDMQGRLNAMFAQDHLSPSVAKLAFTEMVQRWIPHPFKFTDRQQGLERSFEQSFHRAFPGSDAFVRSAFDPAPGAPYLLLNATSVNNGALYVTSPLNLSTNGDMFDFRRLWRKRSMPDFRLSTMAANSARFPVVSPAGSVLVDDGVMRFVDGGYFDNSGAETALSLAMQIKGLVGADAPVLLLHINPNPRQEQPLYKGYGLHPDLDIHELQAVLNSRQARVDLSLSRMDELPQTTNCTVVMKGDPHIPFRLGWILSEPAAQRLHDQVNEALSQSLWTNFQDGKSCPPTPLTQVQ
ncbi:MAG: hypothetical protein ABUL73_01610 [Alphaproteobacteria bacterium]